MLLPFSLVLHDWDKKEGPNPGPDYSVYIYSPAHGGVDSRARIHSFRNNFRRGVNQFSNKSLFFNDLGIDSILAAVGTESMREAR